jgi:hypothetical protein
MILLDDVRSHLILPPNPPIRGEGEFKPRLIVPVVPSRKLTKLSISNVYGVLLNNELEFVFLIVNNNHVYYMPYLYYNIIFVVSYYVNNTNGISTPNSYLFKLLSILSKSRLNKPSPTGEVIVDLHLYRLRHLSGVMTPTASSSSIPFVTVACHYHHGRRRAVVNVKLLVAALVAGILPMLQILLWIVKGFHGVYLTLLTTLSSIPTLILNPPNHRVCL